MKKILTISKWELTRIRVRFGGRSGFIILAIILLAIGAAYLAYQHGMVISKGIYTLGISFDGPVVSDQRFQVIRLEPDLGHVMLSKGALDVYLDRDRIISRDDERSQYTTGALKEYLERQELLRIAEQYDLNRAFPLRIEVSSLEARDGDLSIEPGHQTPLVDETEEFTPAPVLTPKLPEISEPIPPRAESTEASIREQLDKWQVGGLSGMKESFLSEGEIVIPSLMPPVIPLAHVMFSFLFVLPILFTSVFFAASLTEERLSRKLVVLLSTPVSPLQVILGKMLPYVVCSLAVIMAITIVLKSNLLLSIAIFLPVTLFIFSAYLILALTYRTFKDQTFLSILVLSAITAYLVIPALLVGVSDLSYISPLTLVVEMLRGEIVTANQYLLATIPLFLLFLITVFIGTRVFNEEYLSSFKPLHIKAVEMLQLAVNINHLNISAFLSSIFLLPAVFMIELALVVLVSNMPMLMALWILVILSATIEEIAKSASIVGLLHSGAIRTRIKLARLATLSALGFFSGEKLFLFLALGVLTESTHLSAIFGAGLLIMPLVLHVVSTGTVCLITERLGGKYYPLALAMGTTIHAAYNIFMIRTFL